MLIPCGLGPLSESLSLAGAAGRALIVGLPPSANVKGAAHIESTLGGF